MVAQEYGENDDDVPVSQTNTQDNYSVDLSDAFTEVFGTGQFDSFALFEQTLKQFELSTYSVYRVHKSASVTAENQRRKEKVDEKYKYIHATFVCVHYGPIHSKAEVKRKKQR